MADRHRTVSRIVGILEHIVRSEGGATLHELATKLQAPRSTTYDFVRGLVAEGYLAEGAGGRYVLGLGAHTLLASRSTSVVELVDPVMRDLNRDIQETITLAVPVGNELSYVHMIPAGRPIAYTPFMHTRRHFWPTSAGKIFLAYEAVGTNTGEALRTLEVDGALIEEELQRTRERGYATNIGETVTDVAAVALGIRIAGNVVCALSIGGPRARTEEHLEEFSELARRLFSAHGLEATEPAGAS